MNLRSAALTDRTFDHLESWSVMPLPSIDKPSRAHEDRAMEDRIRSLEGAVAGITARLDATLPMLATKADLHSEIASQTWKIVGWVTTVDYGLCTVFFR